jgi:hypothetical protein
MCLSSVHESACVVRAVVHCFGPFSDDRWHAKSMTSTLDQDVVIRMPDCNLPAPDWEPVAKWLHITEFCARVSQTKRPGA